MHYKGRPSFKPDPILCLNIDRDEEKNNGKKILTSFHFD